MTLDVKDSAIRIRVDPANPGQFFACCGLLELADRLWSGAEGWFEKGGSRFSLRPVHAVTEENHAAELLTAIIRCRLTNSMSPAQLQRREDLSSMPKKEREGEPELENEKKEMDRLWRESPLVIHEPFHIRLDWFMDRYAGGDNFKTWAGQQSVFEIARGMKAALESEECRRQPPEDWLLIRARTGGLPFNFDSDLGGLGSGRDVGFSFDPLKNMGVQSRPFLEFTGFVGLQRFRPSRINQENRFHYFCWRNPHTPEIAAPAACGVTSMPDAESFEFRLLYRTKYLKSFLPANPLPKRS